MFRLSVFRASENTWLLRTLVLLAIFGLGATFVNPRQTRTDRVLNAQAAWDVEINQMFIKMAHKLGTDTAPAQEALRDITEAMKK